MITVIDKIFRGLFTGLFCSGSYILFGFEVAVIAILAFTYWTIHIRMDKIEESIQNRGPESSTK